jgi:hypothetical protein
MEHVVLRLGLLKEGNHRFVGIPQVVRILDLQRKTLLGKCLG